MKQRFQKMQQMTPQFKWILYDIEGDGLYNEVRRLWCAVVVDLPTGVVKGFRPEEMHLFYEMIERAEMLAGHNIIDYDNPVLKKMEGLEIEDWRCVDTLVWSRLFIPDRPGGHSLGSWGIRLGEHKGDFNDFSAFSEEMYRYCLQDGVVNYKLLQYFLKNLGWTWEQLWEWASGQQTEL